MTLKGLELVFRVADCFTSVCGEAHACSPGLKGKVKVIERGVVAPIIALARTVLELEVMELEDFLSLSPEEREANKTIKDSEGNFLRDLPTDSAEIRELINYNKGNINPHRIARLLEESAFVANTIVQSDVPIQNEAQDIQQAATPRLNDRILAFVNEKTDGFLSLDSIPDFLHDDLVFSRYVCPISLQPIRYPVADPNGVTVYELGAITEALRNNPVSPVTRRPLTVEQLLPRPALKALIDHRLQYHENQLLRLIRESELHRAVLQNPAELALQNAADIENP